MKIFIATPHMTDTEAGYSQSLAVMIPSVKAQYHLEMTEGSPLSEIRTETFFKARDQQADYLLLVDSDQTFPPDALLKLLQLKKDIVTGVYVRREWPHKPVIYEFRHNGRVRNFTTYPDDKPFKVDACGAGFLLISKKVLQAYTHDVMLKPGLFEDKHFGGPFHYITFMPDKYPEQLGEDVSFCHRMKALGFEIWAEPRIDIGHIGRQTFTQAHFKLALQQVLQADKAGDENPDGWMTQGELDWLKTAAEGMENVVEVGSWKGRSTKALLEGCKGPVTAVDHFEGSDDYGDNTFVIGKAEPIYDIFMKNVGHFPNLNVLRMSSEEAIAHVPDGSADMVFIDSDHRYEQVRAEIERWLPKAKKLICGHDYSPGWPGVQKAVIEKFKKFQVAGTIWFAEVKDAA